MAEFEKTCHLELSPQVDILQNGRRRITRRFELGKNGNIDDVIYAEYGDADPGEITACTTGYANLALIQQRVVPQSRGPSVLEQVFETLTDQWVEEVDPVEDTDLNGLLRRVRVAVALPGTNEGSVVGTATDDGLLLAKRTVEKTDGVWRRRLEFLQPGIVDATKTFDAESGLLYVTFKSFGVKVVPTCLKGGSQLNDDPTVAFQGGTAASIFRDRIENISGYRVFVVTVLMKLDGGPVATDGTETVVHAYETWARYPRPGVAVCVSAAAGPQAFPGSDRWVKVIVQEILTTASALPGGESPPFSVKEWAAINISYVPSDGSAPQAESKGANGYLSNGGLIGTNTTFMGVDVDRFRVDILSTPDFAGFMAVNNAVLEASKVEDFVTDTGVKFYRRRRVTVVGTFGTYLNA